MSRQDLLGGFGWRRCQHDLLNVEDACQLKNHSSLHYEENKSTTNSASALRFDGYVCGFFAAGFILVLVLAPKRLLGGGWVLSGEWYPIPGPMQNQHFCDERTHSY